MYEFFAKNRRAFWIFSASMRNTQFLTNRIEGQILFISVNYNLSHRNSYFLFSALFGDNHLDNGHFDHVRSDLLLATLKKTYKIYIKHLVSESWGWWSVLIGPFYIPDYGRIKRVIGLLDVFLCKRKTALLCSTTVTFLSYMFIYVLVVIKIHCAELTTFDSLWSMPSLLSTTTLTLSAITSLGAVLQLSTTFVWLYFGYWMLVKWILQLKRRLP